MSEALYNKIARFYDDVLGKTEDSAEFVHGLIRKYHPFAKNILELGCGTGIYLNHLKNSYAVTGIDISGKMLSIAAQKIPHGKFHNTDLNSFRLNQKFDIILCLYDTINHITKFSQWKRIFENVFKHLNPEGIFIFDLNTIYKLDFLSSQTSMVHEFKNNYLLIDVMKQRNNIYNWNLKIFENCGNDQYKLNEVNIPEASFEIDRIKTELNKNFKILKAIDTETNRVTKFSERVFFVCKKEKDK